MNEDVLGLLFTIAIAAGGMFILLVASRAFAAGRAPKAVLRRMSSWPVDGSGGGAMNLADLMAGLGVPSNAGQSATAVVDSVEETSAPITVISSQGAPGFHKLGLTVTPGGGAPYHTEVTTTIPPNLESLVRVGSQIPVLVNPALPQLVFPNWVPLLQQAGLATDGVPMTTMSMAGNNAIRSSVTVSQYSGHNPNALAEALAAAGLMSGVAGLTSSAGLPGAGGLTIAMLAPGPATLFVTGVRGTATVTAAQPLGRASDIDPTTAAADAGDMLWQFTAEIVLPGAQPILGTFRHPVPGLEAADIAPGAKLAVAVDAPVDARQIAIDWDQSPLP
jgi:hypothetical protein